MTLLLNDKLAVLYRGGRSRRREFIFKCRRLRGKKGDDSVGKCSKNIRILNVGVLGDILLASVGILQQIFVIRTMLDNLESTIIPRFLQNG